MYIPSSFWEPSEAIIIIIIIIIIKFLKWFGCKSLARGTCGLTVEYSCRYAGQ